MEKRSGTIPECRIDARSYADFRRKLPGIISDIVTASKRETVYSHIDYEPPPLLDKVIEIIYRMREILFPGYFNTRKVDPVNLDYLVGDQVSSLFDLLGDQVYRAVRYECFKFDKPCTECRERGYEAALNFIRSVPSLQEELALDVNAAYEGDPAAKSSDEIIFCYPGIFAIMVYRIAHKLHALGVPLIPRMMTEYSHGRTGIDIHPGAQIGKKFVIDHGTGVVIGETTEIGDNVRIYQGVTLGALSIPREKCDEMRFEKRHPTIEDDVVIYAGATILGGRTVIGARSVIGGNVWITESVPPDTRVVMEPSGLIYRRNQQAG